MSTADRRGGKMATTENVIELLEQSPDPALGTVEVADAFEISQQRAYEKLSKLHSEEQIRKKKVGARAAIWYLPGDYSLSSISSSK